MDNNTPPTDHITAATIEPFLKGFLTIVRAKQEDGSYLEGGRPFILAAVHFMRREAMLCDAETGQPPVTTVKLDSIEVVGFRDMTE